MTHIIRFLFSFLSSTCRSRLSLQLEVAALRHQLSVYRAECRKPRISSSDRLLWSLVSKWWSGWRKALYFVQPRTVVAWQKQRFRDYWRALCQLGRPGRPKIAPELRQLIKRMWQANPMWGSPRIVSELKMLAIDVAMSTVERYKPRHCNPALPQLVENLPLPNDQVLRDVALQTGLLGPNMAGVTFGYGIYACKDHISNRLLAHECRHVFQYESAGSIAAFLPVYLQEIIENGYIECSFEVDARQYENIGSREVHAMI